MAISKQKKEEILKDLKDKLSNFKIVVFVDYSNLDVKSFEGIRKELRKEGVDLKVAKKTLLDMAIKESDIKGDASSLKGQIAVVFGYKDELMPAKIIHGFMKDLEGLKILSGILNREFIQADKIIELAMIPSRDELFAKMVGSMRAPVSGLMNVMQGNMRSLVQVLNTISQKN